jgi:hypothetical protein
MPGALAAPELLKPKFILILFELGLWLSDELELELLEPLLGRVIGL